MSLELDINHSRAVTETVPFSSGLAWEELAEVDCTLTSISLQGSY